MFFSVFHSVLRATIQSGLKVRKHKAKTHQCVKTTVYKTLHVISVSCWSEQQHMSVCNLHSAAFQFANEAQTKQKTPVCAHWCFCFVLFSLIEMQRCAHCTHSYVGVLTDS